jgi:hypothetical protein
MYRKLSIARVFTVMLATLMLTIAMTIIDTSIAQAQSSSKKIILIEKCSNPNDPSTCPRCTPAGCTGPFDEKLNELKDNIPKPTQAPKLPNSSTSEPTQAPKLPKGNISKQTQTPNEH